MRSLREGFLGLCLLALGGQAAPATEADACSAATVEIDEKAGPLGGNERTRRSGPKAAQRGGGHGFYPVRGKLAPPSASKAPLELVITTREQSPPGQPIKLALRFINRSQSPQIVLRPNDGTLEHLRFPHYDLFLRNLETGRVYRWASVGSANRRIKWGGHLPDPTLAISADYELWLEYRFCGYEKRGPAIGRDVEMPGVFKGTLVSNRAWIHVH